MARGEITVGFNDSERALIEVVAQERQISFDEAVQQLFSEGLANRVRRVTRRRPASQVLKFRQR